MVTKLRTYYRSGDALTKTVRKNVVFSLLIKAASIGLNLALVPLTLNMLTKELYGVWLTLSSMVTWFTFIDFGLGNGLRNKLTELLARGERDEARQNVGTLYTATSLICLAFGLLYCAVHPFIDWASLLKVPRQHQAEIQMLAFVLFTSFGLQLVLRNITFILLAVHKSALQSLFPTLSGLITFVLLLVLKPYVSGSILQVGLLLLVPQLLVLAGFHLYFFGGELRYLRPRWQPNAWASLRSFGGLGLSFFVVQLSYVIVYTTANMMITRLLGPAYVTEYDIAFRYFGLLPMVFSIIQTPLWSAFGQAYHTNDAAWIRKTLTRTKQLWLLITAGQIGLILVADFVIPLWVGRTFVLPTTLTVGMMLYYAVYTYGSIHVNLLNGIGKVRLQLVAAIASALLIVPLTYVLVEWLQLELLGVLIAIMICSFYSVLIAPFEAKTVINRMAADAPAEVAPVLVGNQV
ncbi:lipopolysaccharide biosynthesis protein [Larkinella sp. VNQ87]|uniref:lipopolysaccharide biosynthesis protein n=1 Tax=Larkinella sp. VNQ87 TaxID=3400921 RepID=UPI003C08F0EA